MLRDEQPLTPLAGCTDIYVNFQFGTARDTRYIDLWPLDELRGIGREGAALRIGALTTFTELIASPIVRRRLPMLVAASREVGGRQIQHRGTLGGNIANASPAGDSLPVLAACDAEIVLLSAAGERRVPFSAFYTGYRATARRPDELIAAIVIPPVARQAVVAQGRHPPGAGDLESDDGGGASAEPGARRGWQRRTNRVARPRTEDALASGASIAEAARTLAVEIAPIDDLRSTADYRRRVAGNLLARFLERHRMIGWMLALISIAAGTPSSSFSPRWPTPSRAWAAPGRSR